MTESYPILALAERSDTRDLVAAAIHGAGGQAVLAHHPDEIAPAIPYRFVVWSWDGNEQALQSLLPRLRSDAQLFALVPEESLSAFVRILTKPRCNHVIRGDANSLANLTVTLSKYLRGDIFGIEKYLPPGTEVHLTRLRDYEGRQKAIDEVLRNAEQLSIRSKVRSQIGQVCEELLMNALYDAPIDASGQSLFAATDVKERLATLSPRPVSIRYAATETSFLVAVRDRFGRLDKQTLLHYLDKCLHGGEQIDRKVHGAGLGLYLIANAASELVINIAPGMATEAVCAFDRKGVRAGLRLLSVFLYPGLPVVAPSLGAPSA